MRVPTCLMTAGSALFLPVTLLAQEPVIDAKAVTETTEQATRSMLNTLQQAVTGDTAALSDLIGRFLVPAAIALGAVMLGYFVATYIGRVIGGSVANALTRRWASSWLA